jgi:hypothetical protein
MPVVPFSAVPKQQAQRKLSAAEEPWALMAAAVMDAEGRLLHPNFDDRRDQGFKETDNRMVEEQQQRNTGKEILNRLMDEKAGRESKLGRALGAEDMKGD